MAWGKILIREIRSLELERGREADVELAAGEVVGDGILDVVDVGDPVVAAHVGDVHEVEHVESEPYLLEVAE